MRYFVKTPYWLSHWIYPNYIWQLPASQEVFLTFDDGPHPEITSFVLDQLQQYEAKASFFCVGNRLRDFPEIKARILAAGHCLGSHTFNHVDGWKTGTEAYVQEVEAAAALAGNFVFRPPYGHIRGRQAHALFQKHADMRIVMWDVLTGDFDQKLSPARCLEQSLPKIRPGSIIVMHDSEKAWDRLTFVLPRLLEDMHTKKWKLSALPF